MKNTKKVFLSLLLLSQVVIASQEKKATNLNPNQDVLENQFKVPSRLYSDSYNPQVTTSFVSHGRAEHTCDHVDFEKEWAKIQRDHLSEFPPSASFNDVARKMLMEDSTSNENDGWYGDFIPKSHSYLGVASSGKYQRDDFGAPSNLKWSSSQELFGWKFPSSSLAAKSTVAAVIFTHQRESQQNSPVQSVESMTNTKP